MRTVPLIVCPSLLAAAFGGVGPLNRLSPGKKPFAHLRQSMVAVAPVEEAAVQLFFERVNVASHRRVFCSELLGRSRKRPRPCDRQKISKVVPTLTWLPVRHRLLFISAHRLGIYGPLLNENTITCFGQRMLLGDNPKGASPCVLPMIAVQIQA